MELIDIRIDGFRRFRTRTSMNVSNKLIAIVGPNEAGKSSFLRALEHFNDNEPFEESGPSIEVSRGLSLNSNHKVIEAIYLLEPDDVEAITHVDGHKVCKRLTVFKSRTGQKSYSLEPRPVRSLTERKRVSAKLAKMGKSVIQLVEAENNSSEVDWEEEITSLIRSLDSEEEALSEPTVTALTTLSNSFLSSGLASRVRGLEALAKELAILAKRENTPPHQEAINILASRVPQFKLFGNLERNLQSEYSLASLSGTVPIALDNLIRLAGLNLQQLLKSAEEKDRGEIVTILRDVNRKLADEFNEAYSQSSAAVQLDVDTNSLFVLVDENPNQNNRLVQLAERSDGLRQYVALLSFVRLHQNERDTILLIDEAENHLHYDAQADLAQMLAKQELVKKVIYTTHSIGCLPEDLGMGVRLIERVDAISSKITNWFWTGDGEGFSPLLFGMGAQTLAFIPVRRAIVAEGVSDMILLPTLFREAIKKKSLGFQVVPGLSEADDVGLINLERSSKRTLYLTDSDGGGNAIRNRLIEQGFEQNRIFSLPLFDNSPTVSEDYIYPELYVAAVNEMLRRFHGTDERYDVANLPDNERARAVEQWCIDRGLEPVSKRALTYYVVEDREFPSKLDQKKRSLMTSLVKKILKGFG